MNTIICSECGATIEIDKALEGQIEARVLAAERHKHEQELAKLKTNQDALIEKERMRTADMFRKQLEGEKELLKQQIEADLELEKKKLAQAAANEQRKASAEQEALMTALKADAEQAKEDNKKLRLDLAELMKSLSAEKRARENAELEASKKLAESEDKIREDALKHADEKYRLRALEQEKKIADMQKSLDEAQRKAAQGSQQNQGEVLELDLENRLREEFPFDEITEVKKGQRGADLTQTVRNRSMENCGVLLWETKNGKWQPAWIPKFKQDIREANANVGVIVSQEMPGEYGDMRHIEANLWAVKPMLAPVLASALRTTILQVDAAHRNNEGKDAKMEALYQFLVGPEFRHRVEAIVENYSMLQVEIEKEKRAAALRWAHQEKAIRAVIDNTIGMYGDLQGITNQALPGIKTLEIDAGEQSTLL
ncbi:MAG TPA: DUF2130 domain-containing protein [Candidatus Saccharimonadales bacterium]|nr:DUF2130 domain-containing protein [Candidatus Saccharimonadales bacterium]